MCTVAFLWQGYLKYRLEYLRLETLAQRLRPWFRKSLKNPLVSFRRVVRRVPASTRSQGILVGLKCFFMTIRTDVLRGFVSFTPRSDASFHRDFPPAARTMSLKGETAF